MRFLKSCRVAGDNGFIEKWALGRSDGEPDWLGVLASIAPFSRIYALMGATS
jgi:hypothetical protein